MYSLAAQDTNNARKEEEEEEGDENEKERAKESGRKSTGRVIHVSTPELSPYRTLPPPPPPVKKICVLVL